METLIILGVLGVGAFLVLGQKANALVTPATPAGSTLPVNPVGGIPTSASSGQGTQGAIVTSLVGAGAAVATPILATTLTSGAAAGTAAAAAGTSAGTSGAGTAAGAGAAGGAGIATAAITAGVGAVVTIFAILWGKHKQREAQAKNENQAMNIGVAGFDQDIRLINSDYLAHKIDPQTAIAAIQQALAQFAALCAPKIQPDRNGCGMQANGSVTSAITTDALYKMNADGKDHYCQGNIGAACCVYVTSLRPSAEVAIKAIQAGGGTSLVHKVYGSKYGGNTREAYNLNWSRS